MKGFDIIDDDLVIRKGDLVMLDDDILVAVERLITTRLSEFFLQTNMGFDYRILLRKGYRIDEIKNEVYECVMQEPRVSDVFDIIINVDDAGRHASIEFKFEVDGETLESEVFI